MAEPPVLFLDEPTTGLDPRSRTELWRVIRELVGKGTTLLLTTQYLEEADQLADGILVIDHGRAIAQGTSDELKNEVGGERIEVTVATAGELPAAREVLARLAVGEITVEEHRRALEAVAGFLLLLFFAYAFSWVMAYVALLVPSVEVVNNASFMVIFPLTFLANTFVPAENLPGPLQTFAEWNPVSTVTQAARELFGNIPAGTPEPGAWPLQNPALYTLLFAVAIIAVFAPLSVRQYKRANRH